MSKSNKANPIDKNPTFIAFDWGFKNEIDLWCFFAFNSNFDVIYADRCVTPRFGLLANRIEIINFRILIHNRLRRKSDPRDPNH